jgi:hypothetical protein
VLDGVPVVAHRASQVLVSASGRTFFRRPKRGSHFRNLAQRMTIKGCSLVGHGCTH